MNHSEPQRRNILKLLGAGTAAAGIPSLLAPGETSIPKETGDTRKAITEKVFRSPLIDTHEHLPNESWRLGPHPIIEGKCPDWTLLFGHYLDSDMCSAGMSRESYQKFFSPGLDPRQKRQLLEPIWPFIKHTGYGMAVRIAIRQFYGIEDLSLQTVDRLQEAYQQLQKPGFYRLILQEKAGIETCLVNQWPILESEMPDLLKTDLFVSGMIDGAGSSMYSQPAGISGTDHV